MNTITARVQYKSINTIKCHLLMRVVRADFVLRGRALWLAATPSGRCELETAHHDGRGNEIWSLSEVPRSLGRVSG